MIRERAWAVEGFHHVQLAMPPGAEAEAEAEAFYADRLGFEPVAKPTHLRPRGGCWFRWGSTELHLGVDDGFTASAKAHPALRIRGLAALRAALAASGVSVVHDQPLEGFDRCYVRDPFGNRLELIEEGAG